MLGRLFAAGALGSIAGTVVAGFVLIAWVGTLGTLLGVAALDALLAGAFLAAARPRRLAATAAACAVACAALLVAWQRSDALTSPCTVQSSYFCIRVLDYAHEAGRPSRLMVIDHMGHGISDRDEPRFLLAEARTLMAAFPEVEVWVDRRQWAAGGRISFVLLAAATPSPAGALSGESPDDQAEQRGWRRLPREALRRASLAPDVAVLTDDHAPVDRLMQHVLENDL